MLNQTGSSLNIYHISKLSHYTGDLLLNVGNTMTNIGQNIELEKVIKENTENGNRLPDTLQHIGSLSIALGELVMTVNKTFGVDRTKY
ncbi:hypothetical protein NLX67_17340 [Domibacillus sp. A3M-37]|uniref:hypothetical protein n=1 Tax=Domibacillus sp. A3M-37 TaxID=2962037 RepID=UPI0020B8A9AB|nr:hypothetical protein [Domibacillus sp. A3M-37]MCP3764117.1 hypothetical protein [Domibacillus sp. A3M-37]